MKHYIFTLLILIFVMSSCFYNTPDAPSFENEIFNLNIVQTNQEEITTTLSLNQKNNIKPDKVKEFTYCKINFYNKIEVTPFKNIDIGDFMISYDNDNYLLKYDYATESIATIKDNERVEISKMIKDDFGGDKLFFNFPTTPKTETEFKDFEINLDKELTFTLKDKYPNTVIAMTLFNDENVVDVICKYKNQKILVIPENVMQEILKTTTSGHISIMNLIDESSETYSGGYRYILKNQITAKIGSN